MHLMPNGMGTLSLKWIAHCHYSDSTMLNYNHQACLYNLNTSYQQLVNKAFLACMSIELGHAFSCSAVGGMEGSFLYALPQLPASKKLV